MNGIEILVAYFMFFNFIEICLTMGIKRQLIVDGSDLVIFIGFAIMFFVSFTFSLMVLA